MNSSYFPGLCWLSRLAGALITLFLAACAAVVPSEPVAFTPIAVGAAPAILQLNTPALIQLSTGYRRILPALSRWQSVGAVAQGIVYRRLDGVFSIQGRDVHEAYLVVQGSTLHGLYLPVENRFTPIPQPIPLPLGAP